MQQPDGHAPEDSFYLKIFRESPEPIVVSAFDGTILQTNAAFVRAFEFTLDEAIGQKSTELGIWRNPEVRARLMEQFERDGTISNAEIELQTKSGSLRTHLVSVHPMQFPEGNRLLWFFRDITETRHLQEQLRQSQRLESIGTLAGGIAHDFNNILAIIFGFCELAKSEKTTPAVRHYVEEILNGAKRARDLVQQMLAFSRRGEHAPKALRVSTVLKETIRLMNAALLANISISTDIKADAAVMADPSKLRQLFMNLFTNACHAMSSSGGTLGVTTAHVAAGDLVGVPSDEEGGYIAIDVRDNGHGIAEPLLDRVFEPYFTTKSLSEGSGLGLSVVHGIVSEMGGTINVESEEGVGSRFRVVLPVASDSGSPEHEPNVVSPGATKSERVLFVDDEPHVARVYERLLSAYRFRVTSFTDGAKAAAAFRNAPDSFDAVVTDQTMPGMTGLELAEEIRLVRDDVPVVLCTGHSDHIDEKAARSGNVDAFLLKPVAPERLKYTLESVLRGLDRPSETP